MRTEATTRQKGVHKRAPICAAVKKREGGGGGSQEKHSKRALQELPAPRNGGMTRDFRLGTRQPKLLRQDQKKITARPLRDDKRNIKKIASPKVRAFRRVTARGVGGGTLPSVKESHKRNERPVWRVTLDNETANKRRIRKLELRHLGKKGESWTGDG